MLCLIPFQYTTRLLILQGDFTALTIAVYGDLPSETSMDGILSGENDVQLAGQRFLLTILDPLNFSDPILLSERLLQLTPNPPALSLLIRLQFCLKVQDQIAVTDDIQFLEWKDILGCDTVGLEWLERAATMLNLPIAEDVDIEDLRRFSVKIVDSLTEKVCIQSLCLFHTHVNQTNDCLFIFAGLIRRASAQPDIVISILFVGTVYTFNQLPSDMSWSKE